MLAFGSMCAAALRTSLRFLGFALSLTLLAGACGGRVDAGDEEPEDVEGTGGSTTAPAPSGSTKPANGLPSIPLDDCKLGFIPEEEPLRPCAWLGKGRCYDRKLDACACICPNSQTPSTCRSGFDGGPDGRVAVFCS